MTVVSFPRTAETLQLALYEIFSSFFDGQQHILANQTIDFYEAKFVPNIQDLLSATGYPFIAIVGSRVSTGNQILKCKDPSLVQPFGYVQRLDVTRSAYVKLDKSLVLASYNPSGNRKANLQIAFQIWDQLAAICLTQKALFTSKGISHPSLDILPTEATNEEEFLLYGTFTCRIDVNYAHESA